MYEDCTRPVVSQRSWAHSSVMRRERGEVEGFLRHSRSYLRRETWGKKRILMRKERI